MLCSVITPGSKRRLTARILVVDDEPGMRKSLGMALRREQYHVIETGSVAEAIGRLKGESYDLIVTDLMMEPLNGFDLLTLVKQHHPGCPVIIITAFGGPEVRAEALRRGAVDFLDKPIQLPELLLRVQEILTRREGGSIYGSEDSDR